MNDILVPILAEICVVVKVSFGYIFGFFGKSLLHSVRKEPFHLRGLGEGSNGIDVVW